MTPRSPRRPRPNPVRDRVHRRRSTLRKQPESAEVLLQDLRADVVAAIAEIRRLVDDMRPPALDELGLVPALRQRTARVQTPTGQPIRVDVSAPDVMPRLPAA
jgi:two-component system NarL family sensor kinase